MRELSNLTNNLKAGKSRFPCTRPVLFKPLSAEEWCQDLLLSWLFHTSIQLQTSLNSHFHRFGMTVQEASVLLRCVEAREITSGRLAIILGRDKAQTTRLARRLEARGYLTREIGVRDRRFIVLRPTAKARQAAQGITGVFFHIRRELFAGIREDDLGRLSEVLAQLQKNAVRIGCAPSAGRSLHGNWTSRAKPRNQESPDRATQVAANDQLSVVLRELEELQPSLELLSKT